MKFPRNARIFRGQLDVAPFAGVFFLLVMFLLLASLVATPGIQIDLPVVSAAELSGVTGPTVEVEVGKNGQIYFENQLIKLDQLKRRLRDAAQSAQTSQPNLKAPLALTLVLYMDKEATVEMEMAIESLAGSPDVGIGRVVKAAALRTFDKPANPPPPP
jgi:biopolymer transport protein ExbD